MDNRPSKRRRVGGSPPDESRSGPSLDELRQRNAEHLKTTFQSIFDRYSVDLDGVSDVIDLRTGRVVEDNGHVSQMRDELDTGRREQQSPLRIVFPPDPHFEDQSDTDGDDHPPAKGSDVWADDGVDMTSDANEAQRASHRHLPTPRTHPGRWQQAGHVTSSSVTFGEESEESSTVSQSLPTPISSQAASFQPHDSNTLAQPAAAYSPAVLELAEIIASVLPALKDDPRIQSRWKLTPVHDVARAQQLSMSAPRPASLQNLSPTANLSRTRRRTEGTSLTQNARSSVWAADCEDSQDEDDEALPFDGLGRPEDSRNGRLSFSHAAKYRREVPTTRANEDMASPRSSRGQSRSTKRGRGLSRGRGLARTSHRTVEPSRTVRSSKGREETAKRARPVTRLRTVESEASIGRMALCDPQTILDAPRPSQPQSLSSTVDGSELSKLHTAPPFDPSANTGFTIGTHEGCSKFTPPSGRPAANTALESRASRKRSHPAPITPLAAASPGSRRGSSASAKHDHAQRASRPASQILVPPRRTTAHKEPARGALSRLPDDLSEDELA